MTQDGTDGLGIGWKSRFGFSDSEPEIEDSSDEELTIDFGGILNIEGIWLSNLFANNPFLFWTYPDEGTANAWSFSGTEDINLNGPGGVYVDLGGVDLSSVVFKATSGNYSVVGFDLNAVPDTGSSLAFLGLGVLGLVGLRRRFSK